MAVFVLEDHIPKPSNLKENLFIIIPKCPGNKPRNIQNYQISICNKLSNDPHL